MARVETGEFSVEVGTPFDSVQVLGTAVMANRLPRTLTSPSMSIWTGKAEGKKPLGKRLDALIDGKIKLRRPATHAGGSGEFVHQTDRVEDEDGRKVGWNRLRVMLDIGDGGLLQATAMCSDDDLAMVEAALEQALASVIWLKADADAARAASQALFDATLAAARKAMDAIAVTPEDETADQAQGDEEENFTAVLAEHDLADRRAELRALATPAIILMESANAMPVGGSRIGGGPDLPLGMAWPRDPSGFHLNFLVQVDLSTLPAPEAALPASGLLSFFSGTDFSDPLVLHTREGTALTRHDLPEDAEESSYTAAAMSVWDMDTSRMALSKSTHNGLAAETDADGKLRFLRDGEPVLALASEYDISLTPQALVARKGLTLPEDAALYRGIDAPHDLWAALNGGRGGRAGTRHQMLGHYGRSDLVERAAREAVKKGWSDLGVAQDWFVLLAIASGGKANFTFGDAETLVYLANRRDTAQIDFSRVVLVLDQG